MRNKTNIETSKKAKPKMKGEIFMKRLVILTLILLTFAVPASGMLRLLDPAVAAELELIARNQVAADRNIPVAQVVAVEPWLMDLRGTSVEVFVVPLTIGEEKLTAYVRVKDKAIISEKDVEALKAAENAIATKSDRAFVTTFAAETATTDTATEESRPNVLYYALLGGFATTAAGLGAYIFLNKRR